MQKDSRFVQMIIGHNNFQIIHIIDLKDEKKQNVTLVVELSICRSVVEY